MRELAVETPSTSHRLEPLFQISWQILSKPTLMLGLLIVSIVAAAALFPNQLAPEGPNQRGSVMQEVNGVIKAPPYPPGARYPLGSDHRARDLLSRIIHGTKRTLSVAFIAAMLRIGLGTALGAIATWRPGGARHFVLALAGVSAAFPSLLFSYLVISTIGPHRGELVFVIGIGFTGWATWTNLVHNGIQRIWAESYTEASTAIGSTVKFKVRHYLLPNLLPVVIPATAQEIATTLLILAELGFIGLFLGSTYFFTLSELLSGRSPELPVPEWGGMLAGTRFEIFRYYWLPIVPAVTFAVTIFGLYLLAEGLRQALDMPGHRSAPAGSRLRLLAGILPSVRPSDPQHPALPTDRRLRAKPPWYRRLILILPVLVVIVGIAWFASQRLTHVGGVNRGRDQAEFLNSAQVALELGDFDAAEKGFQVVLEQDPDNQEAEEGLRATQRVRDLRDRYDQARELAKAGDWTRALPIFRDIVAEQPDFPDVGPWLDRGEKVLQLTETLTEAEMAFEAGEWAMAITGYDAVRRSDPFFQREQVSERLYETLLQRASVLVNTAGDDATILDSALDLYAYALTLNSQDTEAKRQHDLLQTYLAAMTAFDLGDWESAVSQLEQVWQQQPDWAGGMASKRLASVYLELARTASEEGDNGLAQTHYDQALSIARQTGTPLADLLVATLLEKAETMQQAGEFDLALTYYNDALERLRGNPSTPDLLASIGRPPSLFDLLVQIGEASASLEDWRTAATLYREALYEVPLPLTEGEGNTVAVLYLNRGDAAAEQDDNESALKAYRQAVAALHGEEMEVVYTVATGDTLSAIAARFATTIQVIVEANNIDDPSQIAVGQRLLIPVSTPP